MISVHVLLQNAAKKFYLKILNGYAVFIPGIIFFFWGGGISPKNLQFPQTVAKLCALNLFISQGSELQIHDGNILLMDNKHRKLFVIKQSKWCIFMPKMHQNTFGGRAPSAPAGKLLRSPRHLSCNQERPQDFG